jgi:micrococcal nuclease
MSAPSSSTGALSGKSGPGRTAAKTVTGVVVKVVDGDTIDVKVKGKKHRIRILGIDTPEVHNGVECGGKSASKALKKQLHIGEKVKLKTDSTQGSKDRYGRWLRYVSDGGVDVGLKLIKQGWADAYVYDGHPFARSASYLKAASKAERADRGVWDVCRGF